MTGAEGGSRGAEKRRFSAAWILCVLASLVIFASGHSSPVQAASDRKPTEYDVKAAYLYNFGKFARWPADASSNGSFSICVLGRDPMGSTLDSIVKNETIDGKPVTVSRMTEPEEATSCRIVFICNSEERHLGTILSVLGRAPVLTVSDLPQFTSRGGMIQFVREGERIRFEVNLDAATPQKLTFSSELLRVAAKVTGGGR
jgi:YfiR/HmsC-like